jgi:hypothetical protein
VRPIGDLAHLQDYVFLEHPVEIAKERTGGTAHESLIVGRTVLKKLAVVKVNQAYENAVIPENFNILRHFPPSALAVVQFSRAPVRRQQSGADDGEIGAMTGSDARKLTRRLQDFWGPRFFPAAA